MPSPLSLTSVNTLAGGPSVRTTFTTTSPPAGENLIAL
jgi:hypothetical protein